MKQVNFEKIVIKNLDGSSSQTVGLKKEFSNLLYTQCAGIAAHSLALRIFNSDGAIEVSPEEEELIKKTAEEKVTGIFYDGIRNAIKDTSDDDEATIVDED